MKNESPAPVEIPGDTQSKAWTPAVGERASGIWVGPGEERNVGVIERMGETYEGRPVVALRCAASEQPSGVGGLPWVWLDSLRPASPSSTDPGGWPRKQAEVEMYWTQPDVLPETLPAGVRTVGQRDGDPEEFDAHALVRLEQFADGARYVCEEGYGCCWCPPSHIDWSTVPRPPKPASSQLIDVFGQTVKCSACGCDVAWVDRYTRPNLCGGASTCKGCHFGPTPALAEPVVPERPKLDPTKCEGALHRFPKGVGNIDCYCGAFHHDGLAEPTQYVRNVAKLDASGFLDRVYLDEQTAKRIPERDAARLTGARPSKHHQALAALDVKSGRPRYAETSRVFSTATWEEDS